MHFSVKRFCSSLPFVVLLGVTACVAEPNGEESGAVPASSTRPASNGSPAEKSRLLMKELLTEPLGKDVWLFSATIPPSDSESAEPPIPVRLEAQATPGRQLSVPSAWRLDSGFRLLADTSGSPDLGPLQVEDGRLKCRLGESPVTEPEGNSSQELVTLDCSRDVIEMSYVTTAPPPETSVEAAVATFPVANDDIDLLIESLGSWPAAVAITHGASVSRTGDQIAQALLGTNSTERIVERLKAEIADTLADVGPLIVGFAERSEGGITVVAIYKDNAAASNAEATRLPEYDTSTREPIFVGATRTVSGRVMTVTVTDIEYASVFGRVTKNAFSLFNTK